VSDIWPDDARPPYSPFDHHVLDDGSVHLLWECSVGECGRKPVVSSEPTDD
jgi:hypothetical protein